LAAALGVEPAEVQAARDYLCVLADEAAVRALKPDMAALARLDKPGAIVTAAARSTLGGEVDFVSRFFAPAKGIPEDSATGSAHCTLAPYWAKRLGKTRLRARQISRRGGELECEVLGDRVRIAGRAARYMTGTIHV
jgi:predicted PhzF superfamily epimerase YddE/YHI9